MRKAIIGILLIIFLLCQVAVMGIFTLDLGTRESSVRDAITETGVVGELVTEALGENTVNDGGQYEAKVNAIAESDSVTDFFTAYISNGIRETISGNDVEEIADDELMNSVSAGIDEVNAEGTYTVSTDEKVLLMSSLSSITPDLSAGLTTAMSSFGTTAESTSEVDSTAAYAGVMQSSTRIILIILMAIIVAVIAVLTKTHNRGWWELAVAAALPTTLFANLGFGGVNEDASTTNQFLSIMVSNGARDVAIGGAILVAIFVAVALLNRMRLKKA